MKDLTDKFYFWSSILYKMILLINNLMFEIFNLLEKDHNKKF